MSSGSFSEYPKVAVVGCGYWGKNLVRNFRDLGALEMIFDPSEQGRLLARELAPETTIVENLESVLENDQIAAVALATPAETHQDMAEQCMRAGKDVFVEKPMALTVAEGESMLAVSMSCERILMVGHLLEYHPAVVKLRALLDGGELGKLRYVYSNRLNFGKVRTEENALWSFAPHDLAVILRLMGESPLEVTTSGGTYLTPSLADLTVSCLRFSDERRAHVFVSWLHPFKEQRLVVVGDSKMAVFDDVAPHEQKLVLYPNRVEFDNQMPVLHKEDACNVEFSPDEPLQLECAHFLECVGNRTQPLTDAKSGIDVLRVLQACQDSLEENGNPVSLTPPAPATNSLT
jgi:UDP-2-acetamido-3-amino-2,3-dideoxy-glucuronate N-acetyltransferase